MSYSNIIRDKIKLIPEGTIFGLADFLEINNSQVVTLELSRLFKKGKIKKITKGKYFIPIQSRFGELYPTDLQVLECVIKDNGGYFAGVMALNRIGVTAQVPAEILIRGARSNRFKKIGKLNIRLEQQGIKLNKNIQSKITDVIEALRLIRNTPDGDIKLSVSRVSFILKNYTPEDLNVLIEASMFSRPFVRALLGAILELQNIPESNLLIKKIKNSLNPITRYKLKIDNQILPNKESWNII